MKILKFELHFKFNYNILIFNFVDIISLNYKLGVSFMILKNIKKEYYE